MTHAIGGLGAVEFINLRGQFVQRGGKGLAFAESLEADFAAKVISVVLLDGDVGDNLRVLRKTLRDGRCFAPFFVASPDFEQANFTRGELLELLEAFNRPPLVRDHDGSDAVSRQAPEAAPQSMQSAGHSADGLIQLPRLPKSEAWGVALMKFALEQPDFPANHPRQGRRQMMDAAELLLRACRAGFQRSVEALMVDVATGCLVEKDTSQSP